MRHWDAMNCSSLEIVCVHQDAIKQILRPCVVFVFPSLSNYKLRRIIVPMSLKRDLVLFHVRVLERDTHTWT